MKRLFMTVVAAVSLLSPIAVTTPAHAAPSAPSAVCPLTPNQNGSGYLFTVSGKTSPLRSGPYGECAARVNAPGNSEMSIYCAWTNGFGNVWWYGEIYIPGRGSYMGWMFDNNVYGVYDWDDTECY